MTSLDPGVDDLRDLRARLASSPDASSLRPVGLREIVRGSGSVGALADVLRRLGAPDDAAVTVLSDATPKKYEDRDVLEVVVEALGTHQRIAVELLHASEPGAILLAEEQVVTNAVARVRSRAPDVLVSVGSGTVTDIAKVVASELGLAHIVVQTAASVNGFSDDQSVLLINGAKRTTPSRWPDVLVIDPLVIAHAPLAMATSGLGDQLSMFTASADWYLANAVGFDTSFSPAIVSMMREGVDELLAASTQLGHGEPRPVSALADCLARGGIAMGAAGRTSPSSGLEHTISHLLEMHADANSERSASHGSQVGAASVFAALAWRRVQRRLAEGNVALLESNVATRERVLDAFTHLDGSGATAAECWNLYERKATWIRSHMLDLTRVVDEWSQHATRVDELLAPVDVVATALRNAGAPVSFRQLHPAPERDVVTWALRNCHLLRDRFGILDLADLMGVWSPDDAMATLNELDELAQ
jgi:glycerol-1-phosphate dehydrogenase [NAD(P)+]